MLPLTNQQLLELAREHLGAGRYHEAEPLYRRLLVAFPQEPELWHELGAVAWSTGRLQEARNFFGQAVALNPHRADYQSNLGVALHDLGHLAEAAVAQENALRRRPRRRPRAPHRTPRRSARSSANFAADGCTTFHAWHRGSLPCDLAARVWGDVNRY